MNTDNFEKIINDAWNNKSKINSKSDKKIINAISKTIDLLDSGKIRVAEKNDKEWTVNQWIKKAILLSFRINKMKISKVLMLLGSIKLKVKLINGMKKDLSKKDLDMYRMGS